LPYRCARRDWCRLSGRVFVRDRLKLAQYSHRGGFKSRKSHFDLISNTWDFRTVYILYARIPRKRKSYENDICFEHFVFHFRIINNRLEFIPNLFKKKKRKNYHEIRFIRQQFSITPLFNISFRHNVAAQTYD